MATNTTNFKNKWLHLILAFFPFLNSFSFFNMAGATKNKKWTFFGWLLLILNITCVLLFVILPLINSPVDLPSYYEIEPIPVEEDFMNKEQKLAYYEDYSYVYSPEFKASDEYEAYKKAYDEWNEREAEWKKQPEIAELYEQNSAFYNNIGNVMFGLPIFFITINFVALVMILSENSKYKKMLVQAENREIIRQRMIETPMPKPANVTENKPAPVRKDNPAESTVIDLNSASEEQIASLRGLTIIDAKKAVAYRNEHGGFTSVDEFFTYINAKPHVIVANQNSLKVGNYDRQNKQNTNTFRRNLDL